MGNIFNTLLVIPIINLLVVVYKGLVLIHIPFAFGFSIIILTVLVRLVLSPLTAAQLKSAKKMQEINPHLQKLKEKHKGDAKTLQTEQAKLYKEFGINPLAGCLPLLIQLPFTIGFYQVLNKVVKLDPHTVVSEINSMVYSHSLRISQAWDPNFFGLSLSTTPSHLISKGVFLILLLPVITGLLQFLQSKMMFPAAVKTEKGKKEKKNDDFASAFQSQSTFIFPVMIAVLSYGFPIGLSLYWNTFTIFGIIQQYKIQGWGGLAPYIEKYGRR